MNRSIATCIILSIITLGIYAIYWMYKLNDETSQICGEAPITTGGTLILLTIVTCGIYGIYWAYKTGERIERLHASKGQPQGSTPVVYLLLSLFGLSIVVYALMQSEINNNVQ